METAPPRHHRRLRTGRLPAHVLRYRATLARIDLNGRYRMLEDGLNTGG
jgi:hypothetical protein